MYVGLEPVVFGEPVDGGGHDVGGNLRYRSASSAHQVHVLRVVRNVVRRRAVAEVSVRDQRQLFEQIKRSIDRRDVDPACGLAHLGEDVFCGRMTKRHDRLEHKLPLGREPVSLGTQLTLPADLPGLLGLYLTRRAHASQFRRGTTSEGCVEV